jgi:hypothetical protein
MIDFIISQAKDKAFSVLSEQADRRVFGGAIQRNFSSHIFYYKLIQALFFTQGENAEEFSKEIIEEMKDLVPVDRGALRDSVRFEKTKGRHGKILAGGTPETMKAFKGGMFDEAVGVEYGTANTPAQPFFWPTLRKREKEIAARLKRKIEKEFG